MRLALGLERFGLHCLLMLLGLTAPPPWCWAAGLDPQLLAQTRHCLSCHAVDHKVVGPAYSDVAQRYLNDTAALTRLAQKVRLGGGGVWGAVPMPANAQVTPEEARVLVQWILQLSTPPNQATQPKRP
jgi:cytochrome c